jgi:serine-type D-Ala-D-Ala carboxypeptidase
MKTLLSFALTAVLLLPASFANEPALPWANPWDVGVNYEYLNDAFSEVSSAIAEHAAPGAVGLVMKDGNIIAKRALGNMQTAIVFRSSDGSMQEVPFRVRMIEEALFDMASLTKVLSTVPAIMILIEQEHVELDEPVCRYIPSFGQKGKDKVSIRHLLTHASGLPSWYPFYEDFVNREEVYQSIDDDFTLSSPPGAKRVYSDLNFIMLGRLVEVVSGVRLDEFARTHIYTPLGMNHTSYVPNRKARLHTAPTEFDPGRNKVLRGIVHDENCRVMGGVSGHAGLFSTADDVAIFAQMLLNKGEWNQVRILKEETIETMLSPQLTANALQNGSSFLRLRRQLLGWWGMDESATIGNIGGLPSKTAYGHQGFTGPMLYIDPEHQAAAILLTNAVHPKREDAKKTQLYRGFFIQVSKAILGSANVKIQAE